MTTKAYLVSMPPADGSDGLSAHVSARLSKLRHERYLVDRAIIALTEVSRTRRSRGRRPTKR